MLSSIARIPEDVSIVLIYSNSDNMTYFMYNLLKSGLDCTRDTCIELKNIKDIRKARADAIAEPFSCSMWLYTINVDKREALLKEVLKSLETNVTGVYFIVTSKYAIYKKALKMFEGVRILNYYTARLNKQDMLFLYDTCVPEDKKLSKELFSFVCEEYLNDVDAIFKLFDSLKQGEVVEDKKDIANICGLGNNTIPKFTLGLIDSKINSDKARAEKDLSNPEVLKNVDKGRKKIVRNKVKLISDIREVYDWRYIHSVILSTVISLCDLKVIYINGKLYKKELLLDELEGYDEVSLNRGMKFWFRIHELPLSILTELRYEVEKKVWYSDLDFISFLYDFYK